MEQGHRSTAHCTVPVGEVAGEETVEWNLSPPLVWIHLQQQERLEVMVKTSFSCSNDSTSHFLHVHN
jgi:hypothetical protein